MLVLTAWNMHTVGDHHILSDLGPADAAVPADVSAISNGCLRFAQQCAKTDGHIQPAGLDRTSVKRGPAVHTKHARPTTDDFTGITERTCVTDEA